MTWFPKEEDLRSRAARGLEEAYQNRERPDFSLAERTIWPWVAVRFD